MNIESEIKHFKDLSAIDQSRFLARFMYEMTLEARNFYSPTGTQDIDANKLRFINEIQHRLTPLHRTGAYSTIPAVRTTTSCCVCCWRLGRRKRSKRCCTPPTHAPSRRPHNVRIGSG